MEFPLPKMSILPKLAFVIAFLCVEYNFLHMTYSPYAKNRITQTRTQIIDLTRLWYSPSKCHIFLKQCYLYLGHCYIVAILHTYKTTELLAKSFNQVTAAFYFHINCFSMAKFKTNHSEKCILTLDANANGHDLWDFQFIFTEVTRPNWWKTSF